MSATTNLAITLIDTNQSQKEVTANAAISALDAAITDALAFDVDDGTNMLTLAEVREHQMIVLTAGSPALTGAITVELPATKRMLLIRNDCGEEATIVCDGAATGASEVVIADGTARLVYCDGTQVIGMVADVVSESPPYDVGAFIAGEPTTDEIVMRFVSPRAFTLPASLTGSYAKAAVAATASTDFDIQKNGSSIGTLNFAISGTVGTWTFASLTSFAAGDILSVVAPTTPDASLADISITFAGIRS